MLWSSSPEDDQSILIETLVVNHLLFSEPTPLKRGLHMLLPQTSPNYTPTMQNLNSFFIPTKKTSWTPWLSVISDILYLVVQWVLYSYWGAQEKEVWKQNWFCLLQLKLRSVFLWWKNACINFQNKFLTNPMDSAQISQVWYFMYLVEHTKHKYWQRLFGQLYHPV